MAVEIEAAKPKDTKGRITTRGQVYQLKQRMPGLLDAWNSKVA